MLSGSPVTTTWRVLKSMVGEVRYGGKLRVNSWRQMTRDTYWYLLAGARNTKTHSTTMFRKFYRPQNHSGL